MIASAVRDGQNEACLCFDIAGRGGRGGAERCGEECKDGDGQKQTEGIKKKDDSSR